MSYQKHLYAIMYPNFALVASQLEPADFGRYYSVGSARYYSGKMIFIEVDINYRNENLPIDEYLEQTKEHADGTPKMTKFISSYRVLEHLSVESLGALYAATVSGDVLCIQPQKFSPSPSNSRINIIQELNPVQMLVASSYDHAALGKYLTTPGNPRGCPKLFFTQIDLDVDKFLVDWKQNPFLAAPIPGVHPQKLATVLEALKADSLPRTKSIGIQSIFDRISYSRICNGFFVVAGDELKFYPMPSQEVLQRDHYSWWKHSDM
ncbi:MAG: hypothetical protein J0I12_23070 [Candidatus Eremiobacteraeota bacterium]|nr:hypothetical protein [Candidatus Eremiobacteraeota bacterium]